MKRWIVGLLFTLLALSTLTAQDIEIDHNGTWIVQVTLTVKGARKQARLIVDTGSAMTELDATLADEMKFKKLGTATLTDLTRTTRVVETAEVDEIQVGPYTFQQPKVLLTDRRRSTAPSMDRPADGVLGMNLLRTMAFRWDEATRTFHWGVEAPESYDLAIPIEYIGGLPHLPINLRGKTLKAILDTGSVAVGFVLPPLKMDDAKAGPGMATSTPIATAEGVFDGQISIGKATWANPPVDFIRQTTDTDKVLLGNHLFSRTAILLDLNAAVLRIRTANGQLEVPPFRRFKLGLRWDEERHLIIVGQKPGGPFEKAGFRLGDRLTRLGSLQGSALTIQSASEYLDTAKNIQATIQRVQTINLVVDQEPTGTLK